MCAKGHGDAHSMPRQRKEEDSHYIRRLLLPKGLNGPDAGESHVAHSLKVLLPSESFARWEKDARTVFACCVPYRMQNESLTMVMRDY